MTTTQDARQGWNGTVIHDGSIVLIHAPGFGRSTFAKVTKLGESNGYCEVEIVKCKKTLAGWTAGNRLDIVPAQLEVIPGV